MTTFSTRRAGSLRGRMVASCITQSAEPSQTAATMTQKPAAADPAMAGSRSSASVVATPHRTPINPRAAAHTPPHQAPAANRSAAPTVRASPIGHIDKDMAASPESGNTSASSMAAAATINPNRSFCGFMAALPCVCP